MGSKINSVFTSMLAVLAALATGFFCASVGFSWAKVELSGACDLTQYVTLYYGVCDKVGIRSIGEADHHCWEWRDDGTWENLGSDFEDGALTWQINGYLIGAAAILSFLSMALIILAGVRIIRPSFALATSTLVFDVISLSLSIAAWTLALETAQMNADDWKSAMNCSTKVQLAPGIACALLGSIMTLFGGIASVFRVRALA